MSWLDALSRYQQHGVYCDISAEEQMVGNGLYNNACAEVETDEENKSALSLLHSFLSKLVMRGRKKEIAYLNGKLAAVYHENTPTGIKSKSYYDKRSITVIDCGRAENGLCVMTSLDNGNYLLDVYSGEPQKKPKDPGIQLARYYVKSSCFNHDSYYPFSPEVNDTKQKCEIPLNNNDPGQLALYGVKQLFYSRGADIYEMGNKLYAYRVAISDQIDETISQATDTFEEIGEAEDDLK